MTLVHVLEFDEDIESNIHDVQNSFSVHVPAVWSSIAWLLHIDLLMWRSMRKRRSSDAMSLPRKFSCLDCRQRNQVSSVVHGWLQDIALRCNNCMLFIHAQTCSEAVCSYYDVYNGTEESYCDFVGTHAHITDICPTDGSSCIMLNPGQVQQKYAIAWYAHTNSQIEESLGMCEVWDIYDLLAIHCSCQRERYYCNYLMECPPTKLLWVHCISMNLPDYYNNGELYFHLVNSIAARVMFSSRWFH